MDEENVIVDPALDPEENQEQTLDPGKDKRENAIPEVDDRALQLAYEDAFDNGFVGDKQKFFQILCKNEEAQGWSYESAQLGGYEGSFEDFKNLLGIDAVVSKVDQEEPEVKKKDILGPLSEEGSKLLSLESEFTDSDVNFSVDKAARYQEEYRKAEFKKATEELRQIRPDIDWEKSKDEYYGVGMAPELTATTEYKDVTDISAGEIKAREEKAKIFQEYKEGKRKLTPQQSLVNTLYNQMGRLATVDDTYRYLYGIVTNDLEQVGIAKAELDRIESYAAPVAEFTEDAGLFEDPGMFAAAVADGFAGFATSYAIMRAIPGPGRFGQVVGQVTLASEMIARSIKSYNEEKAKANGKTVEALHADGEFDVTIPSMMGVFEYRLEKLGLSRVGTAIAKLGSKGYSKLAKLLTFGSSQMLEGGTEYGQNILEDVNKYIARIDTPENIEKYKDNPVALYNKIGEEFVRSAQSRESKEALYKGLAGGAGGTIVGASYNKVMAATKSKDQVKSQEDLVDTMLELESMQRNKSLSDSDREVIKTAQDAALDELKKIQAEAEENVSSLNEQQVDEIVKLREEQVSLNNQLWNVENSENLTREQKDKVVESLQKKFKDNVVRVRQIQKESMDSKEAEEKVATEQEAPAAPEQVLTEEEQLLPLKDEQGSTFESPEGSERFIIGGRQRTIALVDASGKIIGAFDSKTGEKRKTTKSSEDELIKQFNYDTGKSAFEGVETTERDDVNEIVANESQNPKEVALAFMQEKEKRSEDSGASQLLTDLREGGQRFGLESLLRYAGFTPKQEGLFPSGEFTPRELRRLKIQLNKNYPGILKWVAKDKKDTNIEDLADTYNTTVDDLFETIKSESPTAPKRSITETNLKERFKELTGLQGTDDQIQRVAEQDPAQLMSPRVPVDVEQELSERMEEERLEMEYADRQGIDTEEGVENTRKSLKTWFNEVKAKIGLDPKRGNVAVRDLQERLKGGMESGKYEAYTRFESLEKQIKNLSKEDQQKARSLSDKILRGEDITLEEVNSFPVIAKQSKEFRDSVDKLSQELINLGVLSPEAADNISNNIGEYLTRSYAAFTDSNYKPDASVRQGAKQFLIDNPYLIEAAARKRAKEENMPLRVAMGIEADNYLDSLLEKDETAYPLGRSFKLDKSILKQRKDVPEPIRRFLGEVKDGRVATYITHLKLNNLVQTAKYQKGMLEQGLGKFIFEKNDPNKPTDAVEITGSAYDILSGYYASPKVIESIIPQIQKQNNSTIQALYDLNGLVKGWKTVYNPTSYMRNYISSLVMLAGKGDFSLKEFVDAHKEYLNTIKGKKIFEEEIAEYKEMGIHGQNIDIGMIKSAMREDDADIKTGLYKRITDKDNDQASVIRKSIRSIYKLGKLGKGIEWSSERMQSIFQAGDDIIRSAAYKKRKKFYADARFNKKLEDLSQEELQQVKEEAANEIKDQYNNYDRVPPAIKKLSRNFVFGSFVQFPAEMIRNSVNVISDTSSKLNDPNEKIRNDARTRLATFLTTQAALLTGTTYLGTELSKLFMLDDEEEDEMLTVKDLRNVVAPWSKNHKILVREMGDNKLSYIDVSANNPYNMISRVVQRVGIDGISNTKEAFDAVFDFFGPFLDQEILTRSIQEAVEGKNSNGKPLYFPTDSGPKKFSKGSMHILESIMPGYVNFIERVTDEDKSTVNELISLTGFRTTEVDLGTSIYFKMKATYNEMQSLQSSYRADLREGKDTYDEAAIRYGEAISKANEVLQSHIRLGLDPKVALEQMKKMMAKNQKFSNDEIKAIIYGIPIAFKPAKERTLIKILKTLTKKTK